MTKAPQDIHSALAETTAFDAQDRDAASAAAPTPEPRSQFAALCWRKSDDKIEILMVTSRDTGRWVIPKGWPISGLAPHETAAREAYEEAGVEGTASDASIGQFGYDKTYGSKEAVPCTVTVFPLKVRRLLERFPERDQRTRKWFSPNAAARLVAEPDLGDLLRQFNLTGPAVKSTAKPIAKPTTKPAKAKSKATKGKG